MDKIGILKAQVDFQKTWFASTLAATIACEIAYWSIKDTTGKTILELAMICFAIACLIFLFKYRSRHRNLIDELNKP